MNHQGKSSKLIQFILAFPILAILVFMGCAGKPVPVEFPVNHPANPEAAETEFIPPQNPFQTGVAAAEEKPEVDSMIKHKMPDAGSPQHGGHNMDGDKERQSDPEMIMKPDHGEGNH